MGRARTFALFMLIIFTFQNCGKFESGPVDFYSYTRQPEFFYDIKLMESMVESDGRKIFEFDVVMAYVRNGTLPIQYHISFFALKSANICDVVSGVAQGDTRHFSMSCRIPADDQLLVTLSLRGSDGTEEQRTYRF